MRFLFICKEIWKGKSIIRSYLNYRLRNEVLRGRTIDIGGGKSSDYISFMKREDNVRFETFDIKVGNKAVDFEKDMLPALDGAYDTVLFLNVLEHIFNYQHIANEVVRITKREGQLIGFVPFLMWYHPDHHDYFRYTHEALSIIFSKASDRSVIVEPIAHGPFIASTQMVSQLLPRPIAVLLFVMNYFLDTIYLRLRPKNTNRYLLGYVFSVRKNRN